jgi:hypothetical protein
MEHDFLIMLFFPFRFYLAKRDLHWRRETGMGLGRLLRLVLPQFIDMLKETLNWGPERGLENCCIRATITSAGHNMPQSTKIYMTVKHCVI